MLGGVVGARGFGRYADEFVPGFASRQLPNWFSQSDWHDFLAFANLIRAIGSGSLSLLESLLECSLR
jgi:hypothetical protein